MAVAAAVIAACLSLLGIAAIHYLPFEPSGEWVSWAVFAATGLLIGSAYTLFGGGTRRGVALLFVLGGATSLAGVFVSLELGMRELRNAAPDVLWAVTEFESLAALGEELAKAPSEAERATVRARALQERLDGQHPEFRARIKAHFENWELPRAVEIQDGSLDEESFIDDWYRMQVEFVWTNPMMWVKVLVSACCALMIGLLGLRPTAA